MIPSPALSFVVTVLRHRITWGVGLALGVWVALAAHGTLKYREGLREGAARADLAYARTDLFARRIADSTTAALRSQLASATARVDTVRVAVTRAEVRTRVATARLTDAISTARADTACGCDALAKAAEDAAAMWGAERDTLTTLITAQDRVILTQSDVIATEPQRMQDALRVALAAQRETFRAPSRSTWAAIGAGTGAVVTFLILALP